MSETNNGPTTEPTPNEGMQPNEAPETQGQQTDEKPEGEGLPPGFSVPKWAERRFAQLTVQRQTERDARASAEARAADLERQLQAFTRQQQGDKPQDNPTPPAPRDENAVRADERQRIERASQQQAFDGKCNAIAAKARSTYGEAGFKQAHANWQNVGLDLNDKGGRAFLEDMASFENAADLYHHIGTDPDLASRLLELSDKERYAELREIARGQPWTAASGGTDEAAPSYPQQQVSQTPRPVARQPGPARTSSRTVYDRNLSMDEFIALRNKKS